MYHRVGFTAAQSAELWEHWKKGEGLKSIGRAVAVTYRGETHKVQVHVILDDGWHIANVIYDNGKSLIDHYRDMSAR